MIDLKPRFFSTKDLDSPTVPISFHPSFEPTYQRLRRWITRFPLSLDESVVNDLFLVQLLAKKKYLDHRPPSHLFRLVLSIYYMQRKLATSANFTSHIRHVAARWIPTHLLFPFSSKPVLGCLIGFNTIDRCELFDEENIIVSLQKHFPDLQLVKESYYRHTSQYENLKIFYFEVEKKNGTVFSLVEQRLLKSNIEEKIKNSIQQLAPSVFMNRNVEEVYKNLLILSQEIRSINDLPQVFITLDQHTGKEIVFHVILVQISPFHRFSLKERLFGCSIVSERITPVRNLDDRPINAHIFRLFLTREPSLLRSDGSLDFYEARQKVVALLTSAVGEFRDYNGGLLIKQQELLFSFKKSLIEQELLYSFKKSPVEGSFDNELIETFFYAIVPIEKQALLDPKALSMLFTYFSEERRGKGVDHFSLKLYSHAGQVFIVIHSDTSISSLIASVLEDQASKMRDWAYNFIETAEGFFFNCVLLHQDVDQAKPFIQALQETLEEWRETRKSQKVLRIGLTNTLFSLDPRISGEAVSSDVLKFLFEGLTRFTPEGHVENAIAETIGVSPNLKEYTFKLRHCFWNNGSLVSAHDFAYAWKKVLSPDFKTNYANLFYPIKNAREAKLGEVSSDEIGIRAIDDQTLKVELVRPTPYFLQLTALPLFSPIHRLIDQDCPQWLYQSGKSYPCNGPFQLNINQPNRAYQLVKNPFYWDASKTSLDQITLTKMDVLQASQAFQKNEIDWLGNPFGICHSSYFSGEQGRVVSNHNDWVGWCVFNTASFPFSHQKIRHAFALAIDRTQLVKGAFLPLTPAYSLLPSRHRDQGGGDFPTIDVKKARELLHEALLELGLSGQELSIDLLFTAQGIQEHIALGLKQQLEKNLEIRCHLTPLAWPASQYRMSERHFQAGLIHWTHWVDDPIYTLNAFRFAKEGLHSTHWEHPDFQRLLDLSEEAINPFQRSLYLRQATEILSREMPSLPLFDQPSQALVRKDFFINDKISFGSMHIARCYRKK